MFNNKLSILFLLVATTFLVSCQLEELPNENAPTLESFSEGASQADVQSLAVGLESILRNDLEFHYETVGYLGREYYDLTGTDPRYTGELLKGPLDNNGFLTTRAYSASYRVVKAANVLINAVQNSEAGFTEATKQSYFGYANTLKAYALLTVANRQYTNGIRVDVGDPDNLGSFLGYNEALVAIRNLLDEANLQLNNNSEKFDFPLAGFEDLREPSIIDPSVIAPLSPVNFIKFNRAIAARIALYQNSKSEVLNFLNESFLDLNGGMSLGVKHLFGLSGNDVANNLFYEIRSGNEFTIHNSWITDAEAGDNRVANKSTLLVNSVTSAPSPASFDGLTGTHQMALYKSNTDPVYLIRNEELILMYAEANIGTDNAAAINAINKVRNAASLPNYSGGMTDADLELELLKQRRYSLLGEGHRWIDLRRFNKLNDTSFLPLDRAGDTPIEAFPTPFAENQ